MTEELMNLDMDLKELFTGLKTDEMVTLLNEQPEAFVREITQYNYDIIKKYYESEKYALLLQHIKFVAYSSFMCEYMAKQQLIGQAEYENLSELFEKILKLKEEQ